MNCFFCQRPAHIVLEFQSRSSDEFIPEETDYKCKVCYATFTYHADHSKVTDWFFIFRYEGNLFRAIFSNYPDEYFALYQSGVEKPIVSVNMLPTLSPQNIQERLPTLITFS